MNTAVQRHDRKRGAVLLVVVVQRKIPPRAVPLLQRDQYLSQMILVGGAGSAGNSSMHSAA